MVIYLYFILNKFSSRAIAIGLFVLCLNPILTFAQSPTLPYEDSQFPCFTKSEAQRYIKDFKIKTSSFGGTELCQPTSDFKKLLNDLSIIEQGRFQNIGTSSFIQGFIDSANYYKWAKMQILKIERDHDISSAIANNVRGNIYIQDYYGKHSVLGRVGTLLHEARHTVYYPHTLCKNGPYAQLLVNGCDDDFAAGGSHAVEMEYYARVSVQGLNFHPVYKAMARLSAMARANFVFNKSPLTKREGLLVKTTSGEFWLQDQNRWIQRPAITLSKNSSSARLKRTSLGASLFTGQQAYAIELYQRFNPFTAIIDSFSYYKTLINLNTRLFDFEEFDIQPKRHIVMISPNNQHASYDFNQGKWNTWKNLNFQTRLSSTTLLDGKSGYFLIDSNAAIYSYEPNTDTFIKTKQTWDFNTDAISKVNDVIYSLRTDKKIIYLNNGQWLKLTLPNDISVDQIASVPLYNGFNITE